MIVTIPIRTVSEANKSEHWTIKSKRHKLQKLAVQSVLRKQERPPLPCKVLITRLSSRQLDYDNLVCSQKWVVDTVCDWLLPGLAAGRADGDPRISIAYHQEKADRYGVRIEISTF